MDKRINSPDAGDYANINYGTQITITNNIQALIVGVAPLPAKTAKRNLPQWNPNYINRDDKMEELEQAFAKTHGFGVAAITQTISGLGGVGKSQLAKAYAYGYAVKHPDAVVWWLNAENPVAACRDFAVNFGFQLDQSLFGKDYPFKKRLEDFLRNWYDNNNDWLLVFDNATDHKSIMPFLPNGLCRGQILITSRTASNWHTPIELDKFTKEQAKEFLCKRLNGIKKAITDDEAETLARRLGRFPLALEQAAAYIVEGKNISVTEYQQLLEKHGVDLLDEGTPIDYDFVIGTTWNITFEKLSDDARHLMYLCAYFAPSALPIDDYESDPFKLAFASKRVFLAALKQLRRFSLIDDNNEIHRLMQEVVRKNLEETAEHATYASEAAYLLLQAFPQEYGTAGDLALAARLAPHAESAAEFCAKLCADKEKVTAADLYGNLGNYYWFAGDYAKALEMHRKALAIKEKVLGTEHPDTAASYNNIGVVYRDMGDYAKAFEMFEKALLIREKVLGTEHPDTAKSYNNIGNAYFAMGDYAKALEMYKKALAIKEKVLGTEHPDTAKSYNNIGIIYSHMGDYVQALEMHQRALSIREKVLGTEHPDTATSYGNIGILLLHQSKPMEAVVYFAKALVVFSSRLPAGHPYIERAATQLCKAYNALGGAEADCGAWLSARIAEAESELRETARA